MVRVELLSNQQAAPVAIVEADAAGIGARGSHLPAIDPELRLLGLPSGRRVTAEEAPEEWARGLIVHYRSPDLCARIVHDDDPLPVAEGRVHLDEAALR